MKISDRLGQISTSVQLGAKSATMQLVCWCIRLFSAFFIGLTLGLVFQELFRLGTFLFLFTAVLSAGLVLRILWKWTLSSLLVFNLVVILVALLLRMYILVAP